MAKSSGKGSNMKSAARGTTPPKADGVRRAHGSQVHGGGRQALHPSAYK